jgi:hypothetical protein
MPQSKNERNSRSTNVKLSVMWSGRVKGLGIGLETSFNSTLFRGYSDSNQSRMVRSLLQGVRDRLGTGLTRAMAWRFIWRSILA